MKSILHYIRRYLSGLHLTTFIVITIFTAFLVFINYQFGLDASIRKNNSFWIKLPAWYTVFFLAFGIPYLLTFYFNHSYPKKESRFIWYLLGAPLLFALKISLAISLDISDDPAWDRYWNQVIYWPLLLFLVGLILFAVWKKFDDNQPFYGFTKRGVVWKPYVIMLMIMVPLIAVASTQDDFLDFYPKFEKLSALQGNEPANWMYKLLYELSYGTDFISIELFFRGFLILGFIKWVGKDAILPMACFYCIIHFGKPLGECISSYPGGIILGIIVYHTRSILGGLLVHLGIAWLMELGGSIGNACLR